METQERYERIALDLIREPSHCLRASIEPGSLGELADSIAAEGLHQPIGVRGPLPDGAYEIVWGHRRLLAVRLLRWADISSRVFPANYDPLLAAVSENLQRTDLTPLEEAHAAAQFVERGMPHVHIARLFRRSPGWIKERLALLDLPPDLQEIVQARALPLAVVELLAQVDHEDYRRSLVRDAIQHGATCAAVEVWLAHYHQDRERILHNHLAVEQIIADRETFVITYRCQWCDELAPYEQTRSFRLCGPCSAQLLEAKTTATTSR